MALGRKAPPPGIGGNRWAESLPGPPTNAQKVAQLEADTQGLIGAILEASPPKVNWSKFESCTQKEDHPKAFVERFMQTFQRYTTLNPEAPERRNLLISASVGNFLPMLKTTQGPAWWRSS